MAQVTFQKFKLQPKTEVSLHKVSSDNVALLLIGATMVSRIRVSPRHGVRLTKTRDKNIIY